MANLEWFNPFTTTVAQPVSKAVFETGFPFILPPNRYADELIDVIRQHDAPKVGWGQVLTQALGVTPTQKVDYGKLVLELVGMRSSNAVNMRYAQVAIDTAAMTQVLAAAFPKVLTDNTGVASVLSGAYALTVIAGLGLVSSPTPAMKYTRIINDLIKIHDSLRNFFSGSVVEGLGLASTLARTYRPAPVMIDTVGLASVLTTSMTFRIILNENLQLTDAQLLHMIFSGVVAENVQITAAYLSPGDNFTTWTVNTRTSAVSEYRNYKFNSFAKLGTGYVGANSSGVYKLSGDKDVAANIIADIKSGMMELGGFKFSSFSAAYVGIRGTGDFVLRLVTGEGVVRDYALKAQNMKTTKVNLGKGLRAKFFAFELISAGADFDLDGVELIPIIAQRRV